MEMTEVKFIITKTTEKQDAVWLNQQQKMSEPCHKPERSPGIFSVLDAERKLGQQVWAEHHPFYTFDVTLHSESFVDVSPSHCQSSLTFTPPSVLVGPVGEAAHTEEVGIANHEFTMK